MQIASTTPPAHRGTAPAPEGFKASVSLAIELYRTELEGIRSTLVRTRSPTFAGYTNQLDFSFAHSPRVHMNQLESLGQNQVRLLNYLSKTVGSPENRMTPGGTLKLTDQTSYFTRGKTQADETKDLLDIIQLARGGVGISTRFSVCQAKDGSTKHIQYQTCLKDKIKPLPVARKAMTYQTGVLGVKARPELAPQKVTLT